MCLSVCNLPFLSDLDYDSVDSAIILSECTIVFVLQFILRTIIIPICSTEEDDFREVFRCTVDLKTCYYELGIELGLPPRELTAIAQDKTTNNPLTGVLLAWLSQSYNTDKYGLPTWRRLVEAVDSPAGGNDHELAKAIASKHTSGT